MKCLLTGGGTGGHVYPALAIATEIQRRYKDVEFLYVGRRDKLEAWVVPQHGFPLQYVRSRPFPRSSSPLALALFGFVLGLGILKAAVILLRFKPALIVCTGGYVSAPIMLAFRVLRKIGLIRSKVFLYEPNAYPGLLNQVAGKVADRIGVAFEQAGKWFDMKRVAVVGYPVRRQFGETTREVARKTLGIALDREVVLAFGGSGGARVINEAVVDALPLWCQRSGLVVIHITGRYAGPDYNAVEETTARLAKLGVDLDTSADCYRRYDYMEQIENAYAAADLVICRGGAGTLTEVCECGVGAIVVPLATAAEDHQAINARQLERQGAARIVYQEAHWNKGQIVTRVDGHSLARLVVDLLERPQERKKLGRAARSIAQGDSLERIGAEIDGLFQGTRPAPLNMELPLSFKGLPADPNQLLRYVQERLREVGGIEAMDPAERGYLQYQADCLLVSEEWYEVPLGRRNVGIKLVGYLNYRKQLPLLLEILNDRTSDGLWRRICGGDFCHGGILRRNAIEYGIRLMGAIDRQTGETLVRTLHEDPYFEARAIAAQVLGELSEPSVALEESLIKALADRSPRVVVEVICALGKVGCTEAVLDTLRGFYLHDYWLCRQQVVTALRHLLERQIVSAVDIEADLDQILAIAPFFKPEFPLKENLHQLAELVESQQNRSEPR